MQNQMLGMDTEQARQHAQHLDSHAEAVNSMVSSITQALGSVTWIGQDATSFGSDWQSSFAPQAQGATQSLQDNAQVLRKYADAQDAVSS